MKNIELLTDLYELTMMQGYFFQKKDEIAVFDYFFRKNPFDGEYSIFAGLAPLLKELEQLSFTTASINYLRSLKLFKEEFLSYLENFEFTCDIYSVKEGEIVFANEPLLEVRGPIMEAQLIESLLLNMLNFQSLIATKTARIVDSAKSKNILEFGLRRAQGIDGALSGSRAAFIGGCSSTSNTLAGKRYNIPVSGTMAHSWVMSFDTEFEAFKKYAEIFPDNCILLVDTFDTLKSGIPNAIKVFKKLKQKGITNFGIRLDSGNLEELSFKAKEMFLAHDLPKAKIFASNELDETIIYELQEKNAPIDAFGVGTKLITANPDASMTGVYKLAAKIEGTRINPVIKLTDTKAKQSNPGCKNIMRFYNENKQMEADLIYLESEEKSLKKIIESGKDIRFNETNPDFSTIWVEDYFVAEKLLKPVMKNGRIIQNEADLEKIKEYKADQLRTLPKPVKSIVDPQIYVTGLSDGLKKMKDQLTSQYD